MKLDKDIEVCINCRTQEEQDMILDILDSLDMRWSNGKKIRDFILAIAPPMTLITFHDGIRQGFIAIRDTYNGIPVVEAKYFKNQWISLKRNLDK